MTATPTGVELWLVRHGRTAWNADRRFQGWTDVPLDEVGRAQARALAAELQGVTFDTVWSSDLDRARATARLALGEAQDVEVDERLRELDFGDVEGARFDQLDADLQRRLLDDVEGFAAPGGESLEELRQRVVEALDALRPGRHAIFAHGGVVRVVLGACGVERFPDPAEVVRVDWTRRRLLS